MGWVSLEHMPSTNSVKGRHLPIFANMNKYDSHGHSFHDGGLNSTQNDANSIVGDKDNAKMFLDEECYDLCEFGDEDVALQPEESSDEHKKGHSINERSSRRPSASSFNRYHHREEIRRSHHVIEEANESSETARAREGLNLHWNIKSATDECDVQENILSCSEPCTQCRGHGVVECQFCHGVGFVDFGQQEEGTVGGRMVRDNGGFTGIHCPVCNEDGEQECLKCNGNGWIAKWKLKDDDSGDILLP